MKAHVLGIRHQAGKSTKTGNDYSIPTLIVRVPIEEVSNSSLTIRGVGFDTVSMPFNEKDYNNFVNFPYPCDLEIETISGQRMGELVSIAVNAKLISAAKPIQAVS
jgi:hypothetical protein